jgi:hypothetical protein
MAASIRRGAKRLPRAIGAAFPPKTMHMGPVATFCAPNLIDAAGSAGRGSSLRGDWGPAGTGLPAGDPDVGPRRRDEDSARHDHSKDMYPESQRRASEDSAPEESEDGDLRGASAREKLFSDKPSAPSETAHGRSKRHNYWGISVSDRQRPDGGE